MSMLFSVMAELCCNSLKYYNSSVVLQSSCFFSVCANKKKICFCHHQPLTRENGDMNDDTAEQLLSLLLQSISKVVCSLSLSSLRKSAFQR